MQLESVCRFRKETRNAYIEGFVVETIIFLLVVISAIINYQ